MKKPDEICKMHCTWFWPGEDRYSGCKAVCSSATYLIPPKEGMDKPFRFTPVEKKILRYIAMENTRKEIRIELKLSPEALRQHIENLKRKASELEEEPDDTPIVHEKEILHLIGMHIVDRPNKVENREFYERLENGKVRKIDEDV